MNPIVKTALLAVAVAGITACGGGGTVPGSGGGGGGPSDGLPADVQAAIDGPKSVLSQEVKDALAYMYSEEGLAHDVYLNIYTIQPQKQLQNIATKAEVKHIDAVNQLAQKYDLNMTQFPDTDVPYSITGIGNGSYPVPRVQYLYDLLYDRGIQSGQDALEVGCMVEVVDVEDLDADIAAAQASNASDVVTVFEFLRDGSYNHYWAFDKGLKEMGVSNGCCDVPDALGYSFCHPEYPNTK